MTKKYSDFLDFFGSAEITDGWKKEKESILNVSTIDDTQPTANEMLDYVEMYVNNFTLFTLEKYHDWLNS